MGVIKKAVKHNFRSTTTVSERFEIQCVQPLFDVSSIRKTTQYFLILSALPLDGKKTGP